MEQAKKESIQLETAFEQLENIVEQLEQDSISLEESFQIYKQGMKLLKKCNEAIEHVEKQVLVLQEDGETHEF